MQIEFLIDCHKLGNLNPFELVSPAGNFERQYRSLIEAYATNAIKEILPDCIESIMASDTTSCSLIRDIGFKAVMSTKGAHEKISVDYENKHLHLISYLEALVDAVKCLYDLKPIKLVAMPSDMRAVIAFHSKMTHLNIYGNSQEKYIIFSGNNKIINYRIK